MSSYAKLRQDLVSSPSEVDGATVYTVKDPIRGTFFRLREPEHWLVHQLDGKTPYEEIAARFKEKFGFNLTAENVLQFVQALEKLFFLENSRAEQAVSRASYLPEENRSLWSRLLFVRLRAINPSRLLDRLVRWYRPWHSAVGWLIQMCLLVAGIAVLATNIDTFAVSLYAVFNLGSIVAVIISFFILIFLHEFAHAVVCRHYGGEVTEMGFLLLYFQPCFYCDLSDAWLFKKKRHRLAVTFAGPYFQALLMAAAVLVWRITVPGVLVNDIARIVAIVCFVTLLFNFNPLIKLDGYYLLSDWLDIPNLRAKAFGFMSNWLKRAVLGWEEPPLAATKREKRVYAGYALLAGVYSIILIFWVLRVLGTFLYRSMGPTGLLLLMALLLFILRGSITSLFKGLIKHIAQMKNIAKKPLRLTVQLIVLIALIIVLFWVPFTQRVTGEVSVRPYAQFSLLVNDLGLLEKRLQVGGSKPSTQSSFVQMTTTEMATLKLTPVVGDGQMVKPGDTVAVLLSNQVTNDLAAGQAELEQLEFELALLRSPPKAEEVTEAQTDVEAAEANLLQLQRDLQRIETLSAKNLTTEAQLETARSNVDIAQATLRNREARLRLLKSPPKQEEEAVIRSRIQRQRASLEFLYSQQAAQSVTTEVGGIVSLSRDGRSVLNVTDAARVELLIPVSDFDLGLVQLAQTVKLKVRTYVDRVFVGQVVHIPAVAVVDGDHSFYQVAALVNNSENLLRSGMTGYAKIEIKDSSLFKLILRKLTSFVRVEFWSWW